MIDTLTPAIKALILDMDGVLWRGKEPLIDMPAFFARASRRGLRVVLATNNATRDADSSLQTLRGFGVGLERWQIITSGMAVTYQLQQRFPQGGPVYVVGETGLVNALSAGGFFPAEENVLAVVAGLDRALTYEKIRKANSFIRGGAPFYGTNPDTTFPGPNGIDPGAGTVLAAISTAAEVAPVIAGKPYPIIFEFALQTLGTAREETLVIGDRLDTDILGGQKAGCRTALVLTGISTAAEARAWDPQPDLIAANLDAIL
jgi:4-nitrophenyl phosphatase